MYRNKVDFKPPCEDVARRRLGSCVRAAAILHHTCSVVEYPDDQDRSLDDHLHLTESGTQGVIHQRERRFRYSAAEGLISPRPKRWIIMRTNQI